MQGNIEFVHRGYWRGLNLVIDVHPNGDMFVETEIYGDDPNDPSVVSLN